jgi:TolB-like protein/class 3 adenylate cyclase/Flp pilus assembly protein TadD
MAEKGFKRKLTAILSADAVEYSRLMGEDEEATVRTLTAYREVLTTLIQQHNGKVLDSPGDNLLAEFVSVVDAVQCAVAVQKEINARNTELPENRRMQFRVGINLGDVIQEEERIYGDGVNIAARLEGLADPGGICISKTAFDQIESKLPYGYEFLGDQTVKNIAKPVGAYRVLMEPRVTVAGEPEEEKPAPVRRIPILVGAAVVLVLAIAVGVWQFYVRRPSVEPSSEEKMAFPLPDKPSIAVLPFVNMSDDPKQEYFADGMTEDLITDLSQMSGLFVIARNSTFVYKGKSVKIRQVAEELGVRYVLEGSVRKAGEQVRINTQLIDTTTGHHLWAKRYDGQLTDVFALQDKISQNIVSALKVKLSIGEQEQVDRKETDNIKAYDAFLQGWNYYRRNTHEDWAKAISHFEKAIELDPDYSRADAALALIYWRYTRTGWSILPDPNLGVRYIEARARAREHLQIAMRKPTSIYYRVGASMALYRRQYARAVAEAEHAIDLNPNNVDGIYTLAYILMAAGKTDRAVELIKKGMRLDPHNIAQPLYLLGMAHFARGQLKEAASLIERALTHNPKLPRLAPFLPAALAHLGQERKAQAALENFKKAVIFYNYLTITFNFPFQDPEVLDRLVDGIRKAGMWAPDFKFFKFFQENMLDEEEIRELMFDRKVAAVWHSRAQGSPYWVERTEDGKATWSIPSDVYMDYNDSGRSWIEDGMLCNQWEIHFTGLKYCMSIFRNPEGTPEMKNEYIGVSDFGFHPFSPLD